MAVWSEVKLSALPGERRLDAEFWRPEYREGVAAITAHPNVALGQLTTTLRKGIFHILASEYVDQGVPFYRSGNVQGVIPSETNMVFITPERNREEEKTRLGRGDIMLAKTGKAGAAIVLCETCNVSQDVIAVQVDRSQINPFYLAVYLNTKWGQGELARWFQGQVQEHLTLSDARRIRVPLLSQKCQRWVQERVETVEEGLKSADRLYAEAETLLEEALGLDKVDFTELLSYEQSFAEVKEAGRLDAEYFQPRMQNVIVAMAASGKTIADVAKLEKRRFEPKRGKEFQYIEIGDISPNGIADSKAVAGEDAPTRAARVVEPGDVITTTVRPIRRLSAIITEQQKGYVCSSGFAVLSMRKPKEVPSELLLLYLRLPVVCEVLDLHTTASMYPAISATRLMKIPFTAPDTQMTEEVVQKVRDSFEARRDAGGLLAHTQDTVAKAIAEP